MKSFLRLSVTTLALLLISAGFLSGQDEAAAAAEEPAPAWTKGAGMGLDFAQLFQLNPRQGAGQNRIGLGGAINFFANYKEGRVAWDNLLNWQFGVQRLGSGVIAKGSTESIPFQKAIDEFRISSKIGYQTSPDSKFFYAADFNFLSQVTPTYEGSDTYAGFFLSDITGEGRSPLSQLFSPATINFSAGIDYKPNEKLSLYLSPIGSKFIVVAEDSIAVRGVHGNPVTRNEDGVVTAFDNVDSQLGATLRAKYTDKYWEDRIVFTSSALLFSNYLRNPQNVDIDWTNELAVNLFKGLQLALTLNVFYDDDVNVQISDLDSPGGVEIDPNTGSIRTAPTVSLTQQILIKYNIAF
jgi:hypothetical protein